MRQLLLTFIYSLLFFISLSSQAQQNLGHTWSTVLNNPSPNGGSLNSRGIRVDAAGNIYVIGDFSNTVDVDPGPGTFNLISAGINDVFFAKFDTNGNLLYAKQFGGTGNEFGRQLAIDASGNVYLTGQFQGTVDFDPGTATANLSSSGNEDVFFAKFDANGNYLFAKSIGSTGGDRGYGITVDGSSNVYVTGYYQLTADFDPGAGTANLTSAGSSDIFFAKYDANGNYVYARSIGSTGLDICFSIAVDGSANVYITGQFQGTADFDPGAGTVNLTSAGNNDIFFAKYNASGNYVFANRVGSTTSDISQAIVVDGSGNLYITGQFNGTVDFDPGASTVNLVSAGNTDIFFAKYSSTGTYVYARKIGGAGTDAGNGLAIDASGSVYLIGNFDGTVDFDPGAGTASLVGSNDVYFAKYNASGDYVYARSVGGGGGDIGSGIGIDGSGYAYVTGNFGGTVDLDPGAGTVTLVAGTGTTNSFFAGYNASGDYRYAKLLGGYPSGTFNEEGKSIAVDGSGNVYVTGYFQGTVDFDPGVGTANLTVAGNNDIYLAKYDANGNLVYARSFGSTGFDVGTSVTVDASGNVYMTGWFNNTVDFDPSPGTANLTSAGSNDVFVAKYDANGNYVYAISFGGTSVDAGFSLKIDGSGNAYVAGQFSNTVDFDPGAGTANLSSAGGSDIFFAKYDASGNYVFAKRMGGTNNDQATGVALDAAGNIYLSAAFGNTVDFDPGTGTVNLVSAGLFDIAVAKYNTAGDYVYAFSIGSSSFDQANAIGVDASGNVYVAGYFDGFVDFDPGAGTAILTSSSSLDIFLAKYDASGNYVFAHKIGSTPGESALGLALDGSGSVYISGYFQGIVDFDPGAGIANLESTGSTDIFIAKYTAAGNYVFAKKIGSAGSDYGNSIAADGNHLYVTGYINGMADTDPSTETINIETINGIDSYIAKYIICSSPALSAQSISANPATVSGATSLTDGGCRLLAVVEPNGASPVSGTVNAQLWIESSVPTFAGQPFVARHYEITPVTNPSTATGRITLYFTQQEFTDFNNHPASTLDLPTGAGDAAGISNLRIGKYNGTSNNGTGLPASYTNGASIIDPADGDIVWNGTLNRWEVSFDVTGFSGFIVQTVSSTLPVNLTSFAARKNGQQSLLSWTTASEQNNKGFYIQRSANGQAFTNLGFVAAKGNGSGASYSFIDAVPLSGRNYYRLQQVDEDGKSSFSPVRELSFGKQGLRIYPNPVQQTLTLSLNAGNEPLRLRLIDLSGRVVKTWSFVQSPGALQLNLNEVPAGNYLLEVGQGVQETKILPVIKQ